MGSGNGSGLQDVLSWKPLSYAPAGVVLCQKAGSRLVLIPSATSGCCQATLLVVAAAGLDHKLLTDRGWSNHKGKKIHIHVDFKKEPILQANAAYQVALAIGILGHEGLIINPNLEECHSQLVTSALATDITD